MEQQYIVYNLKKRKYLMSGQLGYSKWIGDGGLFDHRVAAGICIRANRNNIVEVMIPYDSVPGAYWADKSAGIKADVIAHGTASITTAGSDPPLPAHPKAEHKSAWSRFWQWYNPVWDWSAIKPPQR